MVPVCHGGGYDPAFPKGERETGWKGLEMFLLIPSLLHGTPLRTGMSPTHLHPIPQGEDGEGEGTSPLGWGHPG